MIFIVLLRPWVLIRFGTLRSERIGHFAADTEAYVQERRLRQSKNVIDIIGCTEPVCNRQLELMWRRVFPITSRYSFAIKGLERACSAWTQSSVHSVSLRDRSSEYRRFVDTAPSLEFTEEEERLGRQLLLTLGLPPDAEWVCIHNRDSAYLEKTFQRRFSYHDYRDYNIESMLAAAEELAARDYYVFRMGAIVKDEMPSSNTRIIDYANSTLRSDFLDIYLLARSKFFLGNDSGIYGVPLIFRRPIAMTNFLFLANFYEKDYGPWLFTPKRIRDPLSGRFLTLRETLLAGLGDADRTEVFSAAGVELISNSGEEILELAVELDDRGKGTWKPDPVDEGLQQKFWEIFVEHANGRDIPNRRARIGAGFLRRHTDFLK